MPIDRVLVVGAGTMGQGIAQVALQAGYRVTLSDVDAGVVERGAGRVRDGLATALAKGKIDAATHAGALERLVPTTDARAAAAEADLVIEAVPESMAIKRALYEVIDPALRPGAILASNTSSLGIGELAAGLTRPARFLGMHFFNPVPVMALLEIVVHAGTAGEVLEAARAAGARMGKTCITVKDSPGFASSRLGVALGLEAMRMLEEGVASAQDIDAAMELGYRHPMGPLRLTDLVGLDVRLGIAEHLHRTLGRDAFAPPRILREHVAAGRLGKKSGRGFYEW
ncbi:MAG TPA: 3-hydroxyacyl-CoA dehydrogenase family protein [Candidatus Polarisedimenticolia bacterium]|nr:3-hydroxyacyl-CoA dehydrogenase family protein [Candidatus Polarisedimenticolia bacterium]